MKKTVMNLAIVSCFAFGISLAQASSHGNGHEAASTNDGHAHATSDDYFKKADITGQAQNIKVDAKGVRLPYNMAEDMPSVGGSDHGVRAMHGQPDPFFVGHNAVKPKVESNNFHCMAATNNPSNTCHNAYPSSSGRNFYSPR